MTMLRNPLERAHAGGYLAKIRPARPLYTCIAGRCHSTSDAKFVCPHGGVDGTRTELKALREDIDALPTAILAELRRRGLIA
jgi:hypothetical protein